MTNVKAFLALYKDLKTRKEEESNLKRDEIEAAILEMLKRAKIVDFNEYVRSYKYKRKEVAPHHKQLLLGPRDPRYRKVGAVFRNSRELLGHSGQIERLCFDHGGRFFISGSADGMVKIWDVHTGFLVHSFIGHRSLVNDLCISSDGNLLVSCDFFGLLNVWSLKRFKILFQLRLECEIMFAEFFDTGETHEYNLVVVLAKGAVKTYKLREDGVIGEFENLCLLDEAIKGLCFTDGGRFLLCGGWWPFLVVFDTQASDGCVVLETNGMPVNTICGAKRGLKIAAACDSQVYQWTFFTEGNPGMGNFKRRTKNTSLEGHWKRSIIKVEMEENESIERICYLKDNFLVCVCTDLKIRIFAGTELRCVIDSQEMGVVYPHPTENIFAFCGSHLRIYDMDTLIYEDILNFCVNDAQFSNDGDLFVFGDERGVIKILSMNFLSKSPREQFFVSDFDHINSMSENDFIECNNDSTFNINREKNEEWRQTEYSITKAPNVCLRIEDLGARHFCRDFIYLEVFRKKYMNAPLPGEMQIVEAQVSSESESTVDPTLETSSTFTEESSIEQDAEEYQSVADEKRALGPLRRFFIESDDEVEERIIPVLRRDRVISNEEVDRSNQGQSPADEYGLVRKLRRFNRLESTSPVGFEEELRSRRERRVLRRNHPSFGNLPPNADEQEPSQLPKTSRNTRHKPENGVRSGLPVDMETGSCISNDEEHGNRGYIGRSSSISNLILRNMEFIGNRSKILREERYGGGDSNLSPSSSQALVHNESELTQYVQSWLSSQSLVPQLGDVVYFDEEALKEFQRFDTRKKFKSRAPVSGYYEVEDLKIVRYDPPFLKVTLNQKGASSTIKYYRYPNSLPVLLLKEQLEVMPGDSISFIMNHLVTHGKVLSIQQSDFEVAFGDTHILVDKSGILVSRNLFSEDTKYGILGLLKQKRAYRNLYITLRRESNTSYYEKIASNINLGVIEEKVLHDLYRTIEGFEFDLDIAVSNSFHLGPAFHGYCKQLVESIKSVIENV